MRARVGITLAVALMLGVPDVVLTQPVVLDDSTGSNYTGPPSSIQSSSSTGSAHHCLLTKLCLRVKRYLNLEKSDAEAPAPETLPPPSEDPTSPADGPSQAPADTSNTTIIVAPEAGLGAVLGNNGTAINTTIVQQLTFSGKPGHICYFGSETSAQAPSLPSQHQQAFCKIQQTDCLLQIICPQLNSTLAFNKHAPVHDVLFFLFNPECLSLLGNVCFGRSIC